MATGKHKPGQDRVDRRGGRQYQLPTVRLSDLSPGARTVLSEFETAVRKLGESKFLSSDYTLADDEVEHIQKVYDSKKQAMLRKIIRLQNGDEAIDSEALKRDLRTLSMFIRNIDSSPETAKAQLKASGNVLKIVRAVVEGRRAHPYHAGVAAFERMLQRSRSGGLR